MRIAVLLTLLVIVAASTFLENRRIASWTSPVVIAIHPIAVEPSPAVEEYLATLSEDAFGDIATFFSREAESWELQLARPVEARLAPAVSQLPPAPPEPGSASPLTIALWSLRFRLWAYRMSRADPDPGGADARVFAIFHPNRGQVLEHSLGLDKGRIGVAHLFAGENAEKANAVVIAHEVLHMLGATDKYDARGSPIFPHGYADPNQHPRFPQQQAEIMAGSIPISATEARVSASLEQCVMGEKTAIEIGWASQPGVR